MRILVCYKIVPDEQDISVNPDRTLSFDRAELKIGQYDLNAVEAGAQLAETLGGSVAALTVGGPEVENSKMKKNILSRGPEANYTVNDAALIHADSAATARALAAAARKIGAWDLILCGEGSSDLYAQQVGVQVGELLGVASLNAVSGIKPDGARLLVERTLEDEVETLSVSLPAVLSVVADMNVTRVPSMKEILGAGKKPSTHWSGTELSIDTSPALETVEILAPAQTERRCVVLEGDGEDKIAEFLKMIRNLIQ
ncbi:Protein FixA [bioreactor metagenome]|uniref:Protein FixA n=1 Tax=bioreactor metagenome TaxID=1076179 RepID=A0A645B9W8_9ZZZZ